MAAEVLRATAYLGAQGHPAGAGDKVRRTSWLCCPLEWQLIDSSQEGEEKLGQSLYLAPGAPNTEQTL